MVIENYCLIRQKYNYTKSKTLVAFHETVITLPIPKPELNLSHILMDVGELVLLMVSLNNALV